MSSPVDKLLMHIYSWIRQIAAVSNAAPPKKVFMQRLFQRLLQLGSMHHQVIRMGPLMYKI